MLQNVLYNKNKYFRDFWATRSQVFIYFIAKEITTG
jgi:hypothetical protein